MMQTYNQKGAAPRMGAYVAKGLINAKAKPKKKPKPKRKAP